MVGKDLAGGSCFMVCMVRADLDYLCNYLKLRHFNNRVGNCMFCKANRTNIPWSDLRPSAQWRNCMVSRTDWYLPPDKHVIFTCAVVGITLFHVDNDVMHSSDIGTVLHYSGSASYTLVFNGPFVGSVDERIDAVWVALTKAYDSLGTVAGERLSFGQFAGMFEGSRRNITPRGIHNFLRKLPLLGIVSQL